jgi:hypothetical protein
MALGTSRLHRKSHGARGYASIFSEKRYSEICPAPGTKPCNRLNYGALFANRRPVTVLGYYENRTTPSFFDGLCRVTSPAEPATRFRKETEGVPEKEPELSNFTDCRVRSRHRERYGSGRNLWKERRGATCARGRRQLGHKFRGYSLIVSETRLRD